MSEPRNPKAGLAALLTPDNRALILIDHQPFQVAGLRSHDSPSDDFVAHDHLGVIQENFFNSITLQ